MNGNQHDEASRFLACLDPNANAFTFQTFDDNHERKDGRLARVLHGTLDQYHAELKNLNDRGAGVFVTINETDLKGRTAKNVVRVRALFLDLDGAPLEPVLSEMPPPHVVTETSQGKWHVFWCVADVGLDEFADMQKALAAHFGGDRSVNDLPRVMRLPGFVHRKGAGFESHIVSTSDAPPYSSSSITAPAEVKVEDTAQPTPVDRGAISAPASMEDFRQLNDLAMANLDAWVPKLFPAAKKSAQGGWAVSATALGRTTQEGIGITPKGIKDFGLHDIGDARGGRRTPLELVAIWRKFDDARAAAGWLRAELGLNTSESRGEKSYELIRATDVVMRPKDWIWKGHLLRGAMQLLTGIPGLGKSQVQISLIACATTGRAWPDGSPGVPPVNVIMVVAEDTLDQEVVPRLVAAGADRDRVYFLKRIRQDNKLRMLLLGEDIAMLEQIIRQVGDVGLVTLDPITAFMGKVDSHRATDVRGQLGPLVDLAESTNVAFSCITHPAKHASQRAIDHFIGSQAFIAAGRIGHLCTEEIATGENGKPMRDDSGALETTGRNLFSVVKSNVGKKPETLAYTIEEFVVEPAHETRGPIAAPRVAWDSEPVKVTADQAIAKAGSGGGGNSKEGASRVTEFLEDILANGPVPWKKIEERAAQRGISNDQLKRAKAKLCVQSNLLGFGKDGHWEWTLPEGQPEIPF